MVNRKMPRRIKSLGQLLCESPVLRRAGLRTAKARLMRVNDLRVKKPT